MNNEEIQADSLDIYIACRIAKSDKEKWVCDAGDITCVTGNSQESRSNRHISTMEKKASLAMLDKVDEIVFQINSDQYLKRKISRAVYVIALRDEIARLRSELE